VSLRTWLGFLLVINGYVLIYYRLMVRHYYEEHHQVKESTFGALFSFPPTRRLPERGRRYARRYWVSLALMVLILLLAAMLGDFSFWKQMSAAAPSN